MTNRIEQNSVRELDFAQIISLGGTSSMEVDSAHAKMGWVRKTTLGVAGGVAKLGPNQKLPAGVLGQTTNLGNAITIGPNALAYGATPTNFQITNYDSFVNYTVATETGTVSIAGDIITYTPRNETGDLGFTVNGETFSVRVTARKPLAPVVTFPSAGLSGVQETPTFTVAPFAVDVGSDTHRATRWEVSTTPTFDALEFSTDSNVNLTSWQVGPLNPNVQYYLRVRFEGAVTGNGNWSEVVVFNTGVWRPNTPTLTSPVSGTTGVGSSVTLVSNLFSIPGGGDTHVATDWEISLANSPNTPVTWLSSLNDTVNKISYTSPLLASNTAYVARVRHKGALTGWSNWSTPVSFTTSVIIPNTPVITTPAEGTVNIGKTVTVSTSAFQNTLASSDTHASSHWQISKSALFDTLAYESVDDTVNKTVWTSGTLSPNTHYYIRVRHKSNMYGYSNWSATRTVTTNAQVPNTPAITNLSNGATGVGTALNLIGSNFAMTNGSDTHVASHWQIARTAAFDSLAFESFDDTVNKTSFTVSGLSWGATYFARVRYKGANYGYSSWSTVVQFTTLQPSVTPPTIISPANGATGQSKSVKVTSSQIATDVGVVDMLIGSIWQISTDPTFTNVGETIGIVEFPQTECTFNNLQPNTTYYVRSQHHGLTFGWSGWGQPSSFTTKTSFLPQNEVAKLVDPDGHNAEFCSTFALSKDGNTIAVLNMPSNAFLYVKITIFERNGGGWVVKQKLNFPYPSEMINGPISVISISDDGGVIAFSANHSVAGGPQGMAKILKKQSGTWVESGDITLCSSLSVSGDGGTVVCRPAYTTYGNASIVTYWFEGGIWKTNTMNITTYGASMLGASVKLSKNGEVLVVSDVDQLGGTMTGASRTRYFVYRMTTKGNWGSRADIYSPVTDSYNRYPTEVSISSDGGYIFIVEQNPWAYYDRVFAFSYNGTTWVNETVNTIGNGYRQNSLGGGDISSDGNVAVVGCNVADYSTNTSPGAVFVLARTGGTWSFHNKLTISDGGSGAYFGMDAQLSGDGSLAAASSKGAHAIYLFS